MPKRIFQGVVVSDKMDKTAVVSISRLYQHPRYKKIVRKKTKFQAHDEQNQCKVGDKVSIVEASPTSKNKRWAVIEVLERA